MYFKRATSMEAPAFISFLRSATDFCGKCLFPLCLKAPRFGSDYPRKWASLSQGHHQSLASIVEVAQILPMQGGSTRHRATQSSTRPCNNETDHCSSTRPCSNETDHCMLSFRNSLTIRHNLPVFHARQVHDPAQLVQGGEVPETNGRLFPGSTLLQRRRKASRPERRAAGTDDVHSARFSSSSFLLSRARLASV